MRAYYGRVVERHVTVARYHVEKVGHVSGLALLLALVVPGRPLWQHALAAAVAYTVGSKVAWLMTGGRVSLKDAIADLWIGAFACAVTVGMERTALVWLLGALGVWAAGYALLTIGLRWSSP